METVRNAVVIGVNKYEDERIPELKGAENDATELRQRLVDEESGGFHIGEGHFLAGKDATCDAIRKALSDLLWKTDNSDLSLFYFSGHGFHDEYGNGYIAPWNMVRDEPMVRGIRMRELTDLLLGAKMKKAVLMILDCCYSGIAAEGKAGEADAPKFDEWFSQLGEDPGKGRIILASAGKDEKSHELLQCSHTISTGGQAPHAHGAFTYHLLEALDGKAANGEDDEISLSGLIKYVEGQMKNNANHTPRAFGASMSQAGTIRIARANQWRKIREMLRRAQNLLDRGDPVGAFGAAQALGEILTNFAMVPEAAELKRAVDEKFQGYQGPAIGWLMNNKFELPSQHWDLVERLTPTAADLSVDAILGLRPEPAFMSLLETLVSVSCMRPDGQGPYRAKTSFTIALTGYATTQAHRPSVAKPETGQGKVGSG
jgi:hypothetical protein